MDESGKTKFVTIVPCKEIPPDMVVMMNDDDAYIVRSDKLFTISLDTFRDMLKVMETGLAQYDTNGVRQQSHVSTQHRNIRSYEDL